MAVRPVRPQSPPGERQDGPQPLDRRCPLCGRALRCGDEITRLHGSAVHVRCTRSRPRR